MMSDFYLLVGIVGDLHQAGLFYDDIPTSIAGVPHLVSDDVNHLKQEAVKVSFGHLTHAEWMTFDWKYYDTDNVYIGKVSGRQWDDASLAIIPIKGNTAPTLQAETDALRQRNEELEGKLTGCENRYQRQNGVIQRLNEQVEKLEGQLDEAKDTVEWVGRKEDTANKRVAELEAQVQDNRPSRRKVAEQRNESDRLKKLEHVVEIISREVPSVNKWLWNDFQDLIDKAQGNTD